MAGFRVDRISEDIKREIILLIRDLKDPRVKGRIITVINVSVTSDLSIAKVYVSDMEGIESAKTVCEGLTSAKGYLRRELGNNLHLRKAPDLIFIPDDSVKKSNEMFEKLRIAEERK